MTTPQDPPVWQDQEGYQYDPDAAQSPTRVVATPAQQQPPQGGGAAPYPAGYPAAPTAPDPSGPAQQSLQSLQTAQTAQPAPASDYANHFHDYTENDFKQNQAFGKAVPEDMRGMFKGGDISQNDLDRIKFGSIEPDKLNAADDAQSNGKQQLGRYAQAINAGDTAAVGKADDILGQAESALAFFKFFGPAYNAWTGAGVSYDTLKYAYEAEYGLSFTDYSADSQLLADLSQQLTSIEQNLDNSYNALVPTWQGDAASSFEREMAVFFTATNTVTQDLSVVGKDVAALVHGLQQLVLAKAQTVSELYKSILPNGIDGVMASTLVKVAKGEADKSTNLIAFYLLGGKIHHEGGFWHGVANVASLGTLDDLEQAASEDVAAQAAPGMAAQWCNAVLIPEFETREQALSSVNSETHQRIEQAFAEFTAQVDKIADPYAGMDKAGSAGGGPRAGAQPGGSGGGSGVTPPSVGGGGPGGVPGGTPNVHLPSPPAGSPTLTGTTTPQSTPTVATPTVTPVPPATGAVPTGGPGTGVDPTGTGGLIPPSGLPTGTGGPGADPGAGLPGGVDPKRDIHKNKDGSVSLGRDRGLTISPEHGKKGVFTLTDTDPDGTVHTYTVHFDKHGNPVVTEDGTGGPDLGGIAGISTTPAADLGGGGALTGGSLGGGGSSAVTGGSLGGGAVTGGGISAPAAAHAGSPLQDGVHVGADNAMSASGTDAPASPVAGSAAAGQSSDGAHQGGGGFGGVPFAGGGRGAGGGQEQEAARKYPQPGDVVGEDDLEEWQRMGPVIGEQ
jgi:uncharacterized protein YukE